MKGRAKLPRPENPSPMVKLSHAIHNSRAPIGKASRDHFFSVAPSPPGVTTYASFARTDPVKASQEDRGLTRSA